MARARRRLWRAVWSTVGEAKARVSWLSLTMSFQRKQINRVAVIGAGPSGAAALDALVREQAFDVVRVFERREKAGGVWCV